MQNNNTSYFRPVIEGMEGYTPGEQPVDRKFIKLNTNENPYPPSPAVGKLMNSLDIERLRLYPNPLARELRNVIAGLYGFTPDNIIVGNGSDDILTIAIRSFVGEGDAIACIDPTYSLYEVLAEIQGADCIKIPLDEKFQLPSNLLNKVEQAKLLLIPRPNAPTGNTFPVDDMSTLCKNFPGMILIDEAYADFASDNCLNFVQQFDNVIISRTLSKSYSLAGIRLGFAVARENIIEGMLKVKDSYNVNAITQQIAVAALNDQEYFRTITSRICGSREKLTEELKKRGFKVITSESNFVFASPPDRDGERCFKFLKKNGILVRHFPGERTGNFVRISIGTPEEIETLLEILK